MEKLPQEVPSGLNIENGEVTSRCDLSKQVHQAGGASLSLVGHCLATETEVTSAVAEAQQTDTIRSVVALAGSYAGVLTTDRALTIFADMAGQFPLYYKQTQNNLRVSTSSQQLAKVAGQSIDRTTLATSLCPTLEHLSQTYTFFEGIRRLQGGELLRVTERSITRQLYEDFSADSSVDFDTAAEMTRHSLTDAIGRRLQTEQLTSDFSGGIDSTSLAMLAASLTDQPIPSLVHYHPLYPAGDISYARKLAKLQPGIKLRELEDTQQEVPYSILSPTEVPFFPDQPYHNVDTLGRELRRTRTVHEFGSTLHMLGVGGDVLYDGQASLADLLEQRETKRAWEHALILGRLSLHTTPQQYMEQAEHQRKISLAQAYEMLANLCQQPYSQTDFSVGWFTGPTANLAWLTTEMRQLLATRAEEKAQIPTHLSRGEYDTAEIIRSHGITQQHVHYLGGLTYHAPFLDHKVIRAATQLNAFDRLPPGRFKPLLREALAGHGVAPEVFERVSKGNYSSVSDAGQRQAMQTIKGLLSHSRLAAMGIIDPQAVHRSLDQYGLGHKSRTSIESFVRAEIWVRQHEEFEGFGFAELYSATTGPANLGPVEKLPSPEVLVQRYVLSPDIIFAAGPIQMLALNLRTDQHAALNGAAVLTLQAINSDRFGWSAVDALSKRFPHADKERLRTDCINLLQDLKKEGVIVQENASDPETKPRPLPLWPAPENPLPPDIETQRMRRLQPTEQFILSPEDIARGQQALLEAETLSKQGLAPTIDFLKNIWRATNDSNDVEAAKRDMVVIRQLALDSTYNKQRIVCYESSVAAAIMAARRGEKVAWVIGVAFRPDPDLHGWIEIGSKPILISTDETVEGVYQPLFRI